MITAVSTPAKENFHIVNNTAIQYSFSHHYGYRPIPRGEYIPTFSLPVHSGVAKGFASLLTQEPFITLQDFLDYQQPLVIAFLGAPGQAAVNIARLEKLQAAIQDMGGRLLVLTAVEPKYLRRQLRQSNTLTLFHDRDNAIAELFGLYDLQNPLWQRASGIEEEEQSLPALYVIAPDRRIVYNYVDYDFDLFINGMQVWLKDLLHAVQAVSQQYHYGRGVYKLVS